MQWPTITFLAPNIRGDYDSTVELSCPFGANGIGYHIMIDRYYYGTINIKDRKWIVNFQISNTREIEDKDRFGRDDIDSLIDRLPEIE